MTNFQISVAGAVTTAAVLIPAALAFFVARKRRQNALLANERGRRRTIWSTNDSREVLEAKERFLAQLTLAEGDIDKHKVQVAYEELSSLYQKEADLDEEELLDALDGVWMQLSNPTFPGCLGTNDTGDRQYSMGRVSFGVLKPSDMCVSMQNVKNPILSPDIAKDIDGNLAAFMDGKRVPIPEGRIATLVQNDPTKVRVYSFLVSFTIEDDRYCKRPIEGLMENRGYMYPDPDHPRRMLVWFTGGRFWPRFRRDVRDWCKAFGVGNSECAFGEWRCWLYRAATLETLKEDETFDPNASGNDNDAGNFDDDEPQGPVFSYSTKKPMPGHFDILYLGSDLRITRGNRGTVVANVPTPASATNR
mmetsp:Transcript_4143/g.11745  ORF Transcript_4143/g.11745 Transcript_4143/m.11745 type:complete len:362 (+) Transcript_4143:322-1407(+)|eukprot:CAMPEP_0181039714 /NCGR_PEP_ID=MMETSP1070-20121207/10637_1 /TAXON_ID=265543 /ORGANISM="Minutocellus polymorphus, Strain NH13" /LENGTH=361 /DNA_ID=CAMNT_0023117625 /DNA_START=253 /DNA_END=1338 /DNA_ORIENTATION=+